MTLIIGFGLIGATASKSPYRSGYTIMGPVMQETIVVMDVTGIYLSQERVLNFIPRNLLIDILMVSVIIALLNVGAMLTRLHLIVPNQHNKKTH